MAAELGESERKLHDRFSAWDSFEFTSESGGLELQQVDRKHFLLRSAIRYTGPLGIDVDPDAAEQLRCVGPGEDGPNALGLTDLASVPAPFRWWARSYGIHTPAALIHDRFIGEPERLPAGVTERLVDTYFRKMLEESGVKPLRRWRCGQPWSAARDSTAVPSDGPEWPHGSSHRLSESQRSVGPCFLEVPRGRWRWGCSYPVSYTHLTLPTICSV